MTKNDINQGIIECTRTRPGKDIANLNVKDIKIGWGSVVYRSIDHACLAP